MPTNNGHGWATINEQGQLVIPKEFVEQYGLLPGSQVRLEKAPNHLRLHRPVTQLTKVYIEPTDLCNLKCSMCIRNNWDEPLGRMSEITFERILANLAEMDPKPTVFFGGLGEPLFHPKTIEWITAVKAQGAPVELMNNGVKL